MSLKLLIFLLSQNEMEAERRRSEADYWLVQYARLLDSVPLPAALASLDPRLRQLLLNATAIELAPIFVRHQLSWYHWWKWCYRMNCPLVYILSSSLLLHLYIRVHPYVCSCLCRDAVLELTEEDLQRMGIPLLSTGPGRRLADAIYGARKLRNASVPETSSAAAASKKLEPDRSPEKQHANKPMKRSPNPAVANGSSAAAAGATPSAPPLPTTADDQNVATAAPNSAAPTSTAGALEPRFYMECSVCMERNVSYNFLPWILYSVFTCKFIINYSTVLLGHV